MKDLLHNPCLYDMEWYHIMALRQRNMDSHAIEHIGMEWGCVDLMEIQSKSMDIINYNENEIIKNHWSYMQIYIYIFATIKTRHNIRCVLSYTISLFGPLLAFLQSRVLWIRGVFTEVCNNFIPSCQCNREVALVLQKAKMQIWIIRLYVHNRCFGFITLPSLYPFSVVICVQK